MARRGTRGKARAPQGASALDLLVLCVMRIGAEMGRRLLAEQGRGDWPADVQGPAWPRDMDLALKGVLALATIARQKDGQSPVDLDALQGSAEAARIEVRTGVAAAMDAVGMVMNARYPDVGGGIPVPRMEAYRIPGRTWRTLESMGAGPGGTERWLWERALQKSLCWNFPDPLPGDPGSVVLTVRLDEAGAALDHRATGVWGLDDGTVVVAAVECEERGKDGALWKERHGSVRIGRAAMDTAETAQWESESGEREERLQGLVRGGPLAHALNVAERMVAQRDGRLARLEAAPAKAPGMASSRAKARRVVDACAREAGTGGFMRQWKLPEVERSPEARSGGGGGGEAGTGRRLRTTHGVGGHWKRQPWGPGGRRRRWTRIAPYWRGAGRDGDEGVEWMLPAWDDEGRPA